MTNYAGIIFTFFLQPQLSIFLATGIRRYVLGEYIAPTFLSLSKLHSVASVLCDGSL